MVNHLNVRLRHRLLRKGLPSRKAHTRQPKTGVTSVHNPPGGSRGMIQLQPTAAIPFSLSYLTPPIPLRGMGGV